jgi:hypothetical protein
MLKLILTAAAGLGAALWALPERPEEKKPRSILTNEEILSVQPMTAGGPHLFKWKELSEEEYKFPAVKKDPPGYGMFEMGPATPTPFQKAEYLSKILTLLTDNDLKEVSWSAGIEPIGSTYWRNK